MRKAPEHIGVKHLPKLQTSDRERRKRYLFVAIDRCSCSVHLAVAPKRVAFAAKVAHLRASLGVSERRACGMIGADRTSIRYRSQRGDDAALRGRLRELARQRRRFGVNAV